MIDTINFSYKDSRWQDIFSHLKACGYDVYSPGVKTGECTTPYLVVKNDGSGKLPSFSTNQDLYSIMCYVPQQKYSSLEVLVNKVRKDMEALKPMILPYGTITPSYYDDSVKAHMISIEYKNYKKL